MFQQGFAFEKSGLQVETNIIEIDYKFIYRILSKIVEFWRGLFDFFSLNSGFVI